MALLAIREILLSFALLFGSCTVIPDEIQLMLGRQFPSNGSISGDDYRSNDPASLRPGNINMVGISGTWYTRSREVRIANAPTPYIPWKITPDFERFQDPKNPPKDPQDPAPAKLRDTKADPNQADDHPTTASHVAQDVGDAMESFDAMDWVTRVLLAALAGWILWIYREKLGRLIPGGGGGSKEKEKK